MSKQTQKQNLSNQSRFDIFISYRRQDTAMAAGRIHDFLKRHFDGGTIFRDVEQISPGSRFPETIKNALASSKAMLVVIGEKWLAIADEYGRRRIDNPNDWVRLEIKTALEREILIIPILMTGVQMPAKEALPDDLQKLTEFQALIDVQDRYFYGQMVNLVKTLKELDGLKTSNGEYPDLDTLREIVREEIIDSDDPELTEIMKERLWHEIGEAYIQEAYDDYDYDAYSDYLRGK